MIVKRALINNSTNCNITYSKYFKHFKYSFYIPKIMYFCQSRDIITITVLSLNQSQTIFTLVFSGVYIGGEQSSHLTLGMDILPIVCICISLIILDHSGELCYILLLYRPYIHKYYQEFTSAGRRIPSTLGMDILPIVCI